MKYYNTVRTVEKKEGQLDWSHVPRNCLLKHVSKGEIEGKNEVTGRRVERRKQLLDKINARILEIERGSTRSHPLTSSIWKRLLSCRKMGYMVMMTMMMMMIVVVVISQCRWMRCGKA